MDDKIREFIDKYVEIIYMNRIRHVTPSFAVTADGKVELLMPDDEPLSYGITVQIRTKDPNSHFGKFGSIKDMLCGMSLTDMPDININVIDMDIEHLYGLPDSVRDLCISKCASLDDLSGIPKNVNGDLKLYLHPSTRVNTMPERIKFLFIGDYHFKLTKDVIDMLPYNIKYISVISLDGQPYDEELISLLDRHRSADGSIKIIR